MYKHITTQRLSIRPITPDDADFVVEILNSEGWLQFIGDRNVHNTVASVAYINTILGKENFYYHVFTLKESKQPMGIVSFLYRTTQQYPDIGFAILPQFEHKGYAYEATKAYLDEILDMNIAENIIAILLPNNTSSIKLLEKLQFKFDRNFIENGGELSLYKLK